MTTQGKSRGPLASYGLESYYLLLSLRPHQWAKNLVVLAPLIFARLLFHLPAVAAAAEAFLLFCLLSGAVYLVNDLVDLEQDQLHPVKRQRPLASGRLSPRLAGTAVALLLVVGLAGSFGLGASFGVTAFLYFGLMICYSLLLKNMVILDVLTVSFGFVLRAIAGAVAIGVAFSNWLLVCTMLLALFLSLTKRRHELTLLAGGAAEHRRILGEYSPYLLDQMIAVVTASTVLSYALYTQSPETVFKFGTDRLVWTLPFVLYGIFRYLYLVHQRDEGGNPSLVLFNDRPLLAAVGLWTVAVIAIIYHFGEPG
ncbi:MAG TPA: decaprenyl-phosphate phosphoribosyltransferase [Vicinamibacteria bacterium]|nr:decaprenyl-phosphate phosphoribosyltransferase [Vicinamibacteria bacterium]